MDLIGSANWANYKSLMLSAHDTFNQKTVTWFKSIGGLDRDGEDNLTERFTQITLLCLLIYSDKVTWPTSQYTESGKLDKSNQALMFNMQYLDSLGYLDSDKEFIYNPDTDRILNEGSMWKCSGSSNLSQAPDGPLHCMIIMQKQVVPTGLPNTA